MTPSQGNIPKNTAYRPEIDGLRAIAVLGVALFHVGLSGFTGGYAGVDVFFVISGFLITQFIDGRINAGKFSIGEFYERRIRRILPALVAVCLFTWIGSYFLLLPLDFKSFGASLIATSTFLSNVFFWHKSGYFAAPAATEPLLHTWSLAVEEQFYIFFPLFMLLIAKRTQQTKRLLVGTVLTLSFVLSTITVYYAQPAAFYLPFSRAWELLLGSMLALGAVRPIGRTAIRTGVSALGLALITLSFVLYSPSTVFPGPAALIPCLGTALVIWAEHPRLTCIGRVLSIKPLRWMGLISYSLYLWHWPVLVFFHYVLQKPFNLLQMLFVLLVSVLAAHLSWRFIEQPFRGKVALFSRKQLFTSAAAIGALLFIAGLVPYLGNGLPGRISRQALRYDSGALDYSPRRARCLPSRTALPHYCHFGPKGPPRFFVWGDSHAAALMPAFSALAKRKHIPGEIAALSACAPLLGVYRTNDPQRLCKRFNEAVLDKIKHSSAHTVFLVARWSMDATGASSYELENAMPQIFIQDSRTTHPSLHQNALAFTRGLRRTLEALKGRKVILMLEAPNPDVMVPTYLARAANAGLIRCHARVPFITQSAYLTTERLITPLAKRYHVTVLNPSKLLCRADKCLIALNGRALYMDNQHLSTHGAMLLKRLIAPELGPP